MSPIEELVTLGHTTVPFHFGNIVHDIITDFLPMLDSLPGEKWTMDHPGSPPEENPDTGILIRDGGKSKKGETNDHKVAFHYRRYVPKLLQDRGVELTESQQHFLKNCDRLFFICEDMISSIAQSLQPHLVDPEFAQNFLRSTDSVLRILAYRDVRRDEPEVIGQTHIDRDGFTLTLGESCPGLQVSLDPFPSKWTPVEYTPEARTAHLFCGGRVEGVKLKDGRTLQPLYHRIVGQPNDGSLIRWSVVFFGHPREGMPMKRPTHPKK